MMRNVYNILVNILEVKRSFRRPRCKEKAKRQLGKSVGIRIRLTRLQTETCGGLLWRTLVARSGNWGSIYGKAFIDTISNHRRFKYSVLCRSALIFSPLFCSVILCSYLLCPALFCYALLLSSLLCSVLFCYVLLLSSLLCSVLSCSALIFSVLFCYALFLSSLLCSVPLCSYLLCSVLFCSALLCSTGLDKW